MSEIDGLIESASNDGLYYRLKEAATKLRSEMGLDTIQIFVTVMRGDETLTINAGSGNWSARMGQTREWVIREEGRASRGE